MNIEARMKRVLTTVAVCVLGMVGLAVQAGTVTYYHNDLLGSPVVATNASGVVVWRESYRPYGERLTNAPASSTNDIWFTSRRQDVDTGLVYMGARYYDPAIGRFISTDPKGFDEANVSSFNRYAYANNNPYKYADPDGRNPVLVIVGNAAGGAVIGAGTAGLMNAAIQLRESGRVRWGGLGGLADALGDGAAIGALLGVFGAEYGGAAAALASRAGAESGALTIAEMSGILRDASAGKGNFGLGRATAAESDTLGRAWVGDGYTTAKDGSTLVSVDELRVYRAPSDKPNSSLAPTGVQANFEQKAIAGGRPVSNGHLDITQ
jgi:RHS repeat-associated protein